MEIVNRVNQRSVITCLATALIGIALVYWDNGISNSIGCSLIASAVAVFLHTFIVEGRRKTHAEIWNLDKIYERRSDKNSDADYRIDRLKTNFDCIAFGLSSFRSTHTDKVEECLRNGVNVRILTMDPKEAFIEKRVAEEKAGRNHIKKSIEDLVSWANDIKQKGYNGSIEVRGYKCMPLEFYWRIDNEIYFDPYWYGRPSHLMVTYRFKQGGKGFDVYSKYFEELWHDKELCHVLTQE